MPLSPARAAASDILLRVERESSYASDLLHSSAYRNLSTADHALTTELVMGVLRWRSRLDADIATASSQPLDKLDLEVLITLRLSLYQLRFLDRIPPRAAIHEGVELAKRSRKRSAAPFVNAVLRKLSKQTSPWNPVSSVVSGVGGRSTEDIASTWSHPNWMVERWARNFTPRATEEVCQYNQSAPATSIRLRTDGAESELVAEGLSLSPGSFLRSARRVQSGDVTRTRAFRERRVIIQDEASQLVAALVGCGSRILDCCAAPGGKTLAIADRNPSSSITAVEFHPHRARLMRKLLSTETRSQIKTVVADARHLPLAETFDRILTDVPCSGTGTLARNPEIKWRLKPEDLDELHHRQLAILRSALAHLAPKGRLVYSTCSLEKEENEDVIEKILAENHQILRRDCREELQRLKATGELSSPDPSSLTSGPYLRTIPGIHESDGFLAAILEKNS